MHDRPTHSSLFRLKTLSDQQQTTPTHPHKKFMIHDDDATKH
jgi:hypothetical protein